MSSATEKTDNIREVIKKRERERSDFSLFFVSAGLERRPHLIWKREVLNRSKYQKLDRCRRETFRQ